MIDQEGMRLNVGIIIMNAKQQVLWAKRTASKDAWQFPQGGMLNGESPEQAMYRELAEELGLQKHEVELVAVSGHWFKYLLPKQYRRYDKKPLCRGQKQKWFLLNLLVEDDCVNVHAQEHPEFDSWCWVDYRYPTNHVISFKRDVYVSVLNEFESIVFDNH